MTDDFSKDEKDLLKSLNQRVLNHLPNLSDFADCIITGPHVAQLAVSPSLVGDTDRTFIIFAPETTDLFRITDQLHIQYTLSPLSVERGLKVLNGSNYLKWFTMEYIDLVASDVFVYEKVLFTKTRIILGLHGDMHEYCNHFKYHPIFCYKGKTYVNLFRLKEAKRYAGIIDDKL